MCIRVEACSESARCPHVRSSRYEASVCSHPYRTPHTDGELQARGQCWSGYIVKKVLHPGQKLGLWMATVVRLQDGEGWTPRNVHQSEMMLGTICYRLLAPEQPTASSHSESLNGVRWEGSAQGPVRLTGFCKATADSVRAAAMPPTNGQQAGARRSRPRHRFEAAPKLCRR